MMPIKLYFRSPRLFLSSILFHYGFWIPDKWYLHMLYYLEMGKPLHLRSPKFFQEKLQWLKMYNRRPEYTLMVDKYCAKDYVEGLIGKKHIIPTLGIWDRPEDINFEELPDKFVLKVTNGGGNSGVIVCKNKQLHEQKSIIRTLKKALKSDIYGAFREWPYKNVKPRIIAEKYICDDGEHDGLTDYKFFCFNGYADCVMVCLDRQMEETKFYFFDQAWNLLPLNVRGKNTDPLFKLPKPACIQEMFEIAGRLSKGIPFVRVDFYCSDGKPYFGEMTFFPTSGFDKNLLYEAEQRFGDLIDLSIVNKNK